VDQQLKTDIIEWDTANWGKALDFWQPHLPQSEAATALTLGERHGGLSLWLAQAQLQVTATDLEGVTEKGKALHQRYKVTEQINYKNANMLELPFQDASFDVVCFKSVLGALSEKEKQATAIAEMYRVLKPGGVLLFAENLSGNALHKGLRKRFVKWSTYWRYLEWPEDKALFDAFSEKQFTTSGTLGLLGRSEKQRQILGKLDGAIRPLTRANKRYIVFGALTK